MVRACAAVALCGALLTLAPAAEAQVIVVERLRLQGGYITQAFPAPQPRINDVWIGAVPEVTAFWGSPSTLFSLTYSLTGALHSQGGANEIAHRLTLGTAHAVSPRTTLLLGANAAYTTVSNFLIQEAPGATNVVLYPDPGTRLVRVGAYQGLTYELSPRARLNQSAEASVVTTLPPAFPVDTFFTSLAVGAERIWRNDAVGAEARGFYTRTLTVPPGLDTQFVSIIVGPTWRHDWSRSISSSLAAGGNLVVSPDPGTKPLFGQYGRASLLYTVTDVTSASLNYSTGVVPTPLTGQVAQTHQVALNVNTPISLAHQVYGGASIGYLRASLIDLTNPSATTDYNTLLSDVQVTWQAAPLLQLFARYTFTAQIGESSFGQNPSFLREMFLLGVAVSSRPPGAQGGAVPAGFAQRVDGGDARALQRTEQRPQQTDEGRRDERIIDETGGPAPQPALRGPSRWIYTTPARPPQPEPPEEPSR